VPFKSAKDTRRRLLQRLFSGFLGGLPGIALLLLRAVFGFALLIQGGLYLREPNPTPATWFVGLTALAAAALLLIGLLTPIVGAVVGLGGVGIELSLLPTCTSTLFDSRLPIVFAVTMLLTIIVLGPGAFSVDRRLFGRREIIIPPRLSRSRR
jgi:uncharacterized membrane protein YphA (DoxX/SURF4 family)